MGIDHRGSHVTVAEKCLNRADVIICLKQVRGKRVAEGVGGDTLGELRPPDGLVKRQLGADRQHNCNRGKRWTTFKVS